ncbi:MAG: PTS fructose transporter subunit IIA [Paracoccaceae bacterium]|nr:PTS fructose transporter subunit IIA [Paracoccaceae bacterium]
MAGDIGIVIVAHGQLAREYRAAVEHVVGTQSNIVAVSIAAECDRNGKETEIRTAAESVDFGRGVVIATDLFGSSPSNLALRACTSSDRKIVYGMNLPLLIKLSQSKKLSLSVAVDLALTAGRKYIDSYENNASV